MPKIEGINSLKKKLAKLANQHQPASVVVGFTSRYAIYVHENMEPKLKGEKRPSGLGVYWGPSGQPKFLEQPARELANELGRIVGKGVAAGQGVEDALYVAGLRLQRESMQLVPVEYGDLRRSAFTEKE